MNPERVQMRNDLAMLRRKIANLKEEAAGLILLVRQNISPFGEDYVLRADTAKALEYMKRLHELKTNLVKAMAAAAELEKELGDNE